MDLSNLLNNPNPSPPPWRGQRLIIDQPSRPSVPAPAEEPTPAPTAMGPPPPLARGRGRGARSGRGRGGRSRGGRAAPALAPAPAYTTEPADEAPDAEVPRRIGTRLTQDENLILVEAATSLGELERARDWRLANSKASSVAKVLPLLHN
jgi:hypothetical protein